MAAITLGPIVTDIHGSIGGVTFQRNPSGFIARSKPPKRASTRPGQAVVLSQYASLCQLWQSLSSTQQAEWAEAAAADTKMNKWGVNRQLTGFNLFISAGFAFLSLGVPFDGVFYSTDSPSTLPAFIAELSSGDLRIVFSTPYNMTTNSFLLFTTPPITGVKGHRRGALRLTSFVQVLEDEIYSFSDGWEKAHKLSVSEVFADNTATIQVLLFPIRRINGYTSWPAYNYFSISG